MALDENEERVEEEPTVEEATVEEPKVEEKPMDKLLKIREEMVLPVGLSELEKEKITETFGALKEWLDDANAEVLEKPRLEAYRYVELVLAHLQMVAADYAAGASRASTVVGRPSVEGVEGEPVVVEKSKIQSSPPRKITSKLVDGWLDGMNPQIRSKLTRVLDCFKQYFDPESEVGIDIICNHCNPSEIAKCLIIADSSIVDSSTVFMDVQLK